MAQAGLSPWEQSHPCPSQPTLNHSNTGTSHAAHAGELTGSSHGPSMGDTAARAGPGSVRGPTATKHPSKGHRMDTGPGEMVQDWDGAVLGMVPAGPCLAARLGLRDGASGWEPQAAAVQEGVRDRVQGPSASPASALQCWAGRGEGQEGSSKGTLVSDEGSPLAVGLIILTVRLRGTLLLPDVGGEPPVGDDPAVQGIHLHTPQAEA